MRTRFRGYLGALIALILTALPVFALVGEAQLDDTSYESPHYDYVVEWGSNWAARERETVSEDDVDTLVLTNNDGRLVIAGREDGTADEFLTETVEQEAADAEVTSEDHEAEVPFVEVVDGRYQMRFEAYTLDDAVVVVTLRAREDDFAAALEAAQAQVTINGSAVLEGTAVTASPPGSDEPTEEATEEATETPEPEETPVATPGGFATPQASPVPTGETGLDGSTFTSPGFGFTLEIPADWSVEDELIAVGEERLTLSNGTSVVTLNATSAYSGDLEGCLGYARQLAEADPDYANLRLGATSAGDPFQGVDDRSAYALFRYTGADGTEMAHFVHCQAIVEGESVLILTQDVPYDEYATERGARRQIQNAIDLP
jgi:hypothetical protein